jgi:hypothetical protein
MIELLEADRRTTPAQLIKAAEIKFPGFKCGNSTVRRFLFKTGYIGRICVKKPLLRPNNKERRLEWAKAHENWTKDDWFQVLWSDEKKIELFNSKRRTHCRRKVGKPLRADTIQPTVKHGGGSIMVWGCFGGLQTGDLFRILGILDQHKYHQILVHHAMPSATRTFGPTESWWFMQDNDPKHTSKKVKAYLTSKANAGKMKLMNWPPQSPDLNPLELLWEECDRQVKLRKPTSLQQLEEEVRDVWKNMSSEIL